MKGKGIEAWAVDSDRMWWVFPFKEDAHDKAENLKDEKSTARVVRLVEYSPAEAAVVRAALADWRLNHNLDEPHHRMLRGPRKDCDMCKAVERLQKSRRKT